MRFSGSHGVARNCFDYPIQPTHTYHITSHHITSPTSHPPPLPPLTSLLPTCRFHSSPALPVLIPVSFLTSTLTLNRVYLSWSALTRTRSVAAGPTAENSPDKPQRGRRELHRHGEQLPGRTVRADHRRMDGEEGYPGRDRAGDVSEREKDSARARARFLVCRIGVGQRHGGSGGRGAGLRCTVRERARERVVHTLCRTRTEP